MGTAIETHAASHRASDAPAEMVQSGISIRQDFFEGFTASAEPAEVEPEPPSELERSGEREALPTTRRGCHQALLEISERRKLNTGLVRKSAERVTRLLGG